ncbi:MAG: SpoIID/LytB domain-containing protein [Phycisphaerae bacterium]|nr:SpoIID/LytB domain-containing protein [Phycisphaerae bacterium]MDG2477289.1 SpoIID/LytB domain-containing protein [Phycisphaerales bacterium]
MSIGDDRQSLVVRGGGAEHPLTGPCTLVRSRGLWVIRGVDIPTTISNARVVEFDSPTELTVLEKEGRRYEGVIRCVADFDPPQLSFDVINVVPMEQYIPGVLAGELYEGWHNAAFQAQAIAARSFALSRCQQRSSKMWDVTDTASSQVYIGVPSWDQAKDMAAATSGEVITWKGAVVPGYFSSCCGGRAATATDAVGPNPINAVPPLAGHPSPPYCTEAPRYSWSVTQSVASVSRAIRAWGRRTNQKDYVTIGEVISFTPITPNRHGRPTEIEIKSVGGKSVTIRCVDLPGVFWEANLPSLSSGWVGAEVKHGKLVMNGRGFGHGVGLCQYGAEAMAASAIPYRRIIEFYYPQGTITKAW